VATSKGLKTSTSSSVTTSSSARRSGMAVELVKGSKVEKVTF
jgi:hypothetical protein